MTKDQYQAAAFRASQYAHSYSHSVADEDRVSIHLAVMYDRPDGTVDAKVDDPERHKRAALEHLMAAAAHYAAYANGCGDRHKVAFESHQVRAMQHAEIARQRADK
jgi:hypothetical protein